MELPVCQKCKKAVLVPLSDYGQQSGGEVRYKAWACINQSCRFLLKIRNGEVSYERIPPDRPLS